MCFTVAHTLITEQLESPDGTRMSWEKSEAYIASKYQKEYTRRSGRCLRLVGLQQ